MPATEPDFQQNDAAFSFSNIRESLANSNGLNNNQNCNMSLSITNIFLGDKEPNMTPGQATEEKAFISHPGHSPNLSSLQAFGKPESAPCPKSKIPTNLSRLTLKGEYRIRTREYSTRASLSTRKQAPHCSVTVIQETRKSIKLPIECDVIQNYMSSNFFYLPTVIPLWSPSLGANICEESRNVCVGDVGFFTQRGGFRVLFNIFLHMDTNVELGFEPPDGFEPHGSVQFAEDVSIAGNIRRTGYRHCDGDFTQNNLDAPQNPHRNYISSYHLKTSTSKERNHRRGKQRSGNVLDLPHGAWMDEMKTEIVTSLRTYLQLHAKSWYDYYRPTWPIISEVSLSIVTSSYKCKTWALATCSTTSSEKISASLYKTSDSGPYYDWDRPDEVDVQTGPLVEETRGDEEFLPNQCVAVEVCSFHIAKNVRNATESFRESVLKLKCKVQKTFRNSRVGDL